MKTDTIDNTQDIIDSRDVIRRTGDLQAERQTLVEAIVTADTDDRKGEAAQALAEWDEDYAEELKSLQELADDYSGGEGWEDGAALIRDSYFKEYAEQMASDLGDIDSTSRWPFCHIDWDAAADSLKQDYRSMSFDGVDYWVRA